MTSLERIFIVSLGGALFVSLLNLLCIVIAAPPIFPAAFMMALLAMAMATIIISPIVAGVELIGRLLSARRNTVTLILAIALAVVVGLLVPVPFEQQVQLEPWIKLAGALGMAWLWWQFLPPSDFLPNNQY